MTEKQVSMFENGDDLPLFSGTPQKADSKIFTPKDEHQQTRLYNCPICFDTGIYRISSKKPAQPCKSCNSTEEQK